MKWMNSASNNRRDACRYCMPAWGKTLSRPYAAARNFTKRFTRDEGGAVIILVGLVIIVLAVCAGVSIDAGRGYLLKSRLSGALDAAGLVGFLSNAL